MLLEYLCIDSHTGLPRVSVPLLWEGIISELNLPGATKANCVCAYSLILIKNWTIPNTPSTFGEECMHMKDALQHEETLAQRLPTLLAPGIGFVEDDFSMAQSGGGLGMIQARYIHCALFSIIITLVPPRIFRCERLGTPALDPCACHVQVFVLFSGSEHI